MLRHHLINAQWLFAMDIIIQRAVMAAVVILISGECLLLSLPSWLYFLAIKQYCHRPFGAKILTLRISPALYFCAPWA